MVAPCRKAFGVFECDEVGRELRCDIADSDDTAVWPTNSQRFGYFVFVLVPGRNTEDELVKCDLGCWFCCDWMANNGEDSGLACSAWSATFINCAFSDPDQ